MILSYLIVLLVFFYWIFSDCVTKSEADIPLIPTMNNVDDKFPQYLTLFHLCEQLLQHT